MRYELGDSAVSDGERASELTWRYDERQTESERGVTAQRALPARACRPSCHVMDKFNAADSSGSRLNDEFFLCLTVPKSLTTLPEG